jgi:hypothetical protein
VGYDEWINHDEGGGTLLSRGCEGFVDSDEEEEERGEGSSQSEGEVIAALLLCTHVCICARVILNVQSPEHMRSVTWGP